MQDHNPFLIYRNAVALSVAAHLFFVTTVDAAVFLGKAFVPHFDRPILTIQTIHRDRISNPTQQVLVRKINKPSREETFYKHAVRQVSGSMPQKDSSTVQPKPIKNHPPFESALRHFHHLQAKLDQRIQKFKDDLMNLTAQQPESKSNEWLMSQISDLEKVPSEMRRDLFPEYLKKMRARIALTWLEKINMRHFESEVATVHYRVMQDGTVSELKPAVSKGDELFVESCLSAVEEASPFGMLPFDLKASEKEKYLSVTLTFHLRKQGSKTWFSLERFRRNI